MEATRRVKDGHTYTFLLNHNPEAVTVQLPGPARELLTGADMPRSVELKGRGVMILKA